MRNDQIFVLLLVVLLPMSGCMDNTVGEVEGTEDTESNTTVVNNYYNQTTNQPPVIHVASVGIQDDPVSISTYNSSTGEEVTRMYYTTFQFWLTVTDTDSNISKVGLDLDLDNIIDHEFSNNQSWSDEFSHHLSPGIAQSNGSMANFAGREYVEYCFARFNLIALDDAGGIEIIPYSVNMYHVEVKDELCLDDYAGLDNE